MTYIIAFILCFNLSQLGFSSSSIFPLDTSDSIHASNDSLRILAINNEVLVSIIDDFLYVERDCDSIYDEASIYLIHEYQSSQGAILAIEGVGSRLHESYVPHRGAVVHEGHLFLVSAHLPQYQLYFDETDEFIPVQYEEYCPHDPHQLCVTVHYSVWTITLDSGKLSVEHRGMLCPTSR